MSQVPTPEDLSPSEEQAEVLETKLRQARKTGVLNLSQSRLSSVPDRVWAIQDAPEEAAVSVSMDNTEDKWWEMMDLTKLFLASNSISTIGDGLRKLTALTVLDVHDNELTSLPDALGSLRNLCKLDARHNHLSDLPACIGQLAGLHSLVLDYNKLTSIREEVCNLRQLVVLTVSNNLIKNLPRDIGHLTKLTTLSVANNRLSVIPPEVGTFSELILFDAAHNKLTKLPDEFKNLKNLHQLYLRHNQITHFPQLHSSTNLMELVLGDNCIEEIPAELMQHLSSLVNLEIRANKLREIPPEIALLEKLERLDLANNHIRAVPLLMGEMTHLKILVLDGNPLFYEKRETIMKGTSVFKYHLLETKDAIKKSPEVRNASNGARRLSSYTTDDQVNTAADAAPHGSGVPASGHQNIDDQDFHRTKSLNHSFKNESSIPDSIVQAAVDAGVRTVNLEGNLFNQIPSNLSLLAATLTELNFAHNKLTDVTDINKFQRLQVLNLSSNQLSDLPPELSELLELQELNISSNRFTFIPAVVYGLANLQSLSVNDNLLAELDVPGFSKLTKLNFLNLTNNDISRIPPELGNCTWLCTLHLTGNPIRYPRTEILAKSTKEILEYLRSRIVT